MTIVTKVFVQSFYIGNRPRSWDYKSVFILKISYKLLKKRKNRGLCLLWKKNSEKWLSTPTSQNFPGSSVVRKLWSASQNVPWTVRIFLYVGFLKTDFKKKVIANQNNVGSFRLPLGLRRLIFNMAYFKEILMKAENT